MLDYFCSVPLPTPLRANPARNGDPGCAGLGCHRSSFSRLPRISFGGGTAGPSTPPEAGSARDDNSRESAGSARDDNSRESAGSARDDNSGGNNENRGPSTPLRSAQDDTQVFWLFVQAGRRLAELQVNYEQQIEYPLERVEKGQLNWRVEKMRLSKDKTTLVYNDFLTLKGIPLETYEYRLGNRSALEWVIDQYQVSTDKRSGIVNDPNRADDPEYIVRLVGQVITVSLGTMKVVKSLPALAISA